MCYKFKRIYYAIGRELTFVSVASLVLVASDSKNIGTNHCCQPRGTKEQDSFN